MKIPLSLHRNFNLISSPESPPSTLPWDVPWHLLCGRGHGFLWLASCRALRCLFFLACWEHGKRRQTTLRDWWTCPSHLRRLQDDYSPESGANEGAETGEVCMLLWAPGSDWGPWGLPQRGRWVGQCINFLLGLFLQTDIISGRTSAENRENKDSWNTASLPQPHLRPGCPGGGGGERDTGQAALFPFHRWANWGSRGAGL